MPSQQEKPSWPRLAARAALTVIVAASCGVGCSRTAVGPRHVPKVIAQATRPALQTFASEQDLTDFLRELAKARERDRSADMSEAPGGAMPSSSPPPAPPAEAATADESVTNTQHAGVDEGGIVKVHGDHLVVLRRGRLFTVEIGGDALAPTSQADAFGPGIDPAGTWYDEMLVGDDTIVVIGYSYQRGGTELGLFDINAAGRIRYRATYHLRSNDYYSSRNYASRLIGKQLVFYSPLYLSIDGDDPYASFPALRRWRTGVTDQDFQRIARPQQVYRPLVASSSLTLHTVTTCDLAQPQLSCQATVVMGPPGRVFYVSPSAVYVWMTQWQTDGPGQAPDSLVYRLPLDGTAPGALRTVGGPVDQFSFLERDGHLNVLVRADARGAGMWSAEVTDGDVALLRVPLKSFSANAPRLPQAHYTALPRPSGYTFHNRFVGDFLLYGAGAGWGPPEQRNTGSLHAYRYAGQSQPTTLALRHGVDRIEVLGRDAVVIGTDGENLHFSPIALDQNPSVEQPYTRQNASQGELRSHGFFYKPEGERVGLLGLPIRSARSSGAAHLVEDSASILFLRHEALRFSELGDLGSRPDVSADDGCQASCVDWYGNARPLFLRGRIFALLGYELVEGTLEQGRLAERRRVSFAPAAATVAH